MKKLIVIALAVVMTFAVVAFAACDSGETATGYCYYANNWGGYGCVVDVTVKDGVITAVKLYTDADAATWAAANNIEWKEGTHRTTPSWTAAEGQLGFAAAEAAYEEWMGKVFVGKTVEEVNAYVASATADGQTVGTAAANLAGATQSSARIIVAVKNALSKIGK